MWKTLSEWLFAFFNMARELQDHRSALRRMEERMRNLEEAIRVQALETRRTRELDAAEREKLAHKIEGALSNQKSPSPARRKKRQA